MPRGGPESCLACPCRVRLARPVRPLLEVLDPSVRGEVQHPQVAVLLAYGVAVADLQADYRVAALDRGRLRPDGEGLPFVVQPEGADRCVPDLGLLVRRGPVAGVLGEQLGDRIQI